MGLHQRNYTEPMLGARSFSAHHSINTTISIHTTVVIRPAIQPVTQGLDLPDANIVVIDTHPGVQRRTAAVHQAPILWRGTGPAQLPTGMRCPLSRKHSTVALQLLMS